MKIKYKFENGYHTFRTEDRSIDYGFIGSYEDAVKMLAERYALKDFEIV